MKNLVAKAGVAAVTSVLFSSVISVPEANALNLTPAEFGIGILANDGTNTVLYDLEGRTSANAALNQPGVVEIGEFYLGGQPGFEFGAEMRGYIEFDISSLFPADIDEAIDIAQNRTYSINFDVLSQGGSGTAGDGSRNNLGNAYTGVINAFWYAGEAISSLDFNLNAGLGNATSELDLGMGDPIVALNPLASFQVPENGAGTSVSIDATALVRFLLLDPLVNNSTPTERFGIMLQATELTNNNPGVCGGMEQRECQGITFNNFGVEAVPTPAAILPSLFGFATAAIRKKKRQAIEA